MVKAFEAACGEAIAYQLVDRRAGDIAACYANPDKAHRSLVGLLLTILMIWLIVVGIGSRAIRKDITANF